MREEIKNCRTLEGKNGLFEMWKMAHIDDDRWRETFPCNGSTPPESFKGSFCPDGKLTDSAETEILFICRESNVDAYINKNGETNDTFYVKSGKPNRYYNCIENIAKYLGEEIDNCAYMNINKRGGYSSCCQNRLYAYAKAYKEFIKREIEIINPEKIIILGALHQKIVDIIKDSINGKSVKLIKYKYHPSRYRRKIDENDLTDIVK